MNSLARTSVGAGRLLRAPLAAAGGLALLLSGAPSAAQLTDVNPDGVPTARFGGRALGLTVHPHNSDVIYVATEGGGFFESTDGGTHWRHIDQLLVPWGWDIVIDPQDPSIIIASARADLRIPHQGGIWRSADAGATWSKPATSNPGCFQQAATWGIAIPDDPAFHQNVYVASDCGIAISSDSGATWTHVDPCTTADAAYCDNVSPYHGVAARVVGGQVQLDVCGDEGFFRSPNGGATWTTPDAGSPARRVPGGAFNPCRVATAPQDPNTVYLANWSGLTPPPVQFCISRLMENAAAGTAGNWVDMGVTSSNCRDPWVVTQPDKGGNANRYQVYFGDSVLIRVQTCDSTQSPRCNPGVANWQQGDIGGHGDPSDIAFDTSSPNGCPIVHSSDGGVSTSSDCGVSWQDGNRGLHALDVVTFAGTLRGGGVTDLYAGTQDNGIYASLDNAANWTRPKGADGYNVLADRRFPARVFFRVCFGCSDGIADPGLLNDVPFSDPPGTIPVFAVATQFGPRRYVFLTNDGATPPNWRAWATTDEGASWGALGPNPLPAGPDFPQDVKVSGAAAARTFYLRLAGLIYSLTGPLDSTATLSPAFSGLSWVGAEWDVDPNDPMRLYAADFGRWQMMVSTNGGASWAPDLPLTALVLGGNTFRFAPSGVAFDPFGDKVIVATRTAGLMVSVNNGQTWSRLAGSERLTNIEEFFFDPDNDVIWAASRGRGIWRISLPDAQIQVPGDLDLGSTCVGAQGVAELHVCNAGKDDLVVDPITSSNPQFGVTEPSGGYPVTISPDFCFPFQVTFDPLSPGGASTTLNVPSNDLETPTTQVLVTGGGTVPDIRVTGSTAFGFTSAWTPAEKRVSVCNTGGCDLSVASAAVSCGEFTLVNDPFPATVSPDSCVDLVVRFTPTLPGPKACDLTITSNDPDTPVVTRALTARTPPAISFHTGLVDPHGALNGVARQGSTFNLAYVNPFAPRYAWDVRLGFASFDGRAGLADTELWTVGANFRFTVNPAAPVRFLLNGGLGVYHFDPGDFEGGGNLGLGLNVPVGRRFAFEATYNHHLAFTASPDLEYGQAQLGFVVSF